MARILLTHTPDMRRNYYGERALAGLRLIGGSYIGRRGVVLIRLRSRNSRRRIGVIGPSNNGPGQSHQSRQHQQAGK